jgi:hypothetical protein
VVDVKRWLSGWSWTAAAVAAAWVVFGAVLWMIYGPVQHPINFGPVSVHPTTVHAGGVVVVTRSFDVFEPVVLTVTRNLVPVGEPRRPVYGLPETRVLWKPGKYANPRAHEIPDYVVPGKYRMELVAEWRVNFLRQHSEPLAPVEFEVVAR